MKIFYAVSVVSLVLLSSPSFSQVESSSACEKMVRRQIMAIEEIEIKSLALKELVKEFEADGGPELAAPFKNDLKSLDSKINALIRTACED